MLGEVTKEYTLAEVEATSLKRKNSYTAKPFGRHTAESVSAPQAVKKERGGESLSQCDRLGTFQRIRHQDSMSSRPPNLLEDGRYNPFQPAQQRNEAEQIKEQVRKHDRPQEQGNQRPMIHQSQEQIYSPQQDPKASSARSIGVHAILNPPESDARSPTFRTGGESQTSPYHAQAPGPYQNPYSTPSADPRYVKAPDSPAGAPSEGHGEVDRRRMANLRSPRRISLGNRATMNAQAAPFLSGQRTYPGPPSADLPSMARATSYSYPPAAAPGQQGVDLRHRASVATMPSTQSQQMSQSASPSPSMNSSYSSQPSPAPRQQGQPQQYYPGRLGGTSRTESSPTQASLSEASYPPDRMMVGGSQNPGLANIRMIPISAADGAQFYVPVDVQQASRAADEKRARNASASARFRERRRVKEKEANKAIQKLEHQLRETERAIREMEMERDFYRNERNRFRDIVYRNPSTRDLALQAPPSPRAGRVSSYAGHPSSGGNPNMGTGMSMEMEDAGRPARRRRLEGPPETQQSYARQASTSLPPVQMPNYAPGPGGLGPQVSTLPPIRTENVSGGQGGPPPQQVPPSASRSPYEGYHNYERGGWQGGPGPAGKR